MRYFKVLAEHRALASEHAGNTIISLLTHVVLVLGYVVAALYFSVRCYLR